MYGLGSRENASLNTNLLLLIIWVLLTVFYLAFFPFLLKKIDRYALALTLGNLFFIAASLGLALTGLLGTELSTFTVSITLLLVTSGVALLYQTIKQFQKIE